MPAQIFKYYDDWKSEIFTCPKCGWTGTFEDGSVEYYDELMDCSCPKCPVFSAPMLAIVSYPTEAETEANWVKLSEFEKASHRYGKLHREAFELTSLKSETELPDIDMSSVVLTWDIVGEGSIGSTVIWHGEKEIWREIACFEAMEEILIMEPWP